MGCPEVDGSEEGEEEQGFKNKLSISPEKRLSLQAMPPELSSLWPCKLSPSAYPLHSHPSQQNILVYLGWIMIAEISEELSFSVLPRLSSKQTSYKIWKPKDRETREDLGSLQKSCRLRMPGVTPAAKMEMKGIRSESRQGEKFQLLLGYTFPLSQHIHNMYVFLTCMFCIHVGVSLYMSQRKNLG